MLSLPEGSRYVALKDVAIGGVVVLRDQKPEDKEQLVEPVAGIVFVLSLMQTLLSVQ